MQIITDKVHPDEPCWGYYVGPQARPGPPGEDDQVRMIEWVFVIRGDAIAKYERDLGPADDYPYVPPLKMPSWGENPVGLMQWHGERHIHDPKWAQMIQEYKAESTLFRDILRQEEQRHELINNRSNFGPAGNFQRNGYSRVTNWRRYRDERARRTGRKQL